MRSKAYAKINLCLDVVGKREDGYHELKMIMVPVDFYDVLEIEKSAEMSISSNRSYLPVNDKNTVIKAIHIMQELYGFDQNFECKLTKHIPSQAGLGGGSADGAAAIRMMNQMMNLHLSQEELIEVAKKVGADVPFCLLNQPAYVEGIGEKLTPFECNTDFEILLVKPRRGVSTSKAFAGLNFETMVHPDCEKMRDSLINNDYEGVIASLGNSLEEVSLELVQEIQEIKDDLYGFGFDGVLMSGSGSTVFGITKNQRMIHQVLGIMRAKDYFVRSTKILKSWKEY